MAINLVIRDGEPHWWNSPDIWVVPGTDPNGAPGQPIAGQPAFLWGRVRNNGESQALGARVNFYWSNPATGVLRSNSTLVGSAFVDLNPSEAKEVLCVIPWVPVIVNDGHECLVAEVVHGADPLPVPLPDPFDPPAHHQVAQKNISVLMAARMMMVTVQVAAPARTESLQRVGIDTGGKLSAESLRQLGLGDLRPADAAFARLGLSLDPGCDPPGKGDLAKELKVKLGPGATRAVYLHVLASDLKPGTYVLVHVISRDEHRVVGGITFVVTPAKEG